VHSCHLSLARYSDWQSTIFALPSIILRHAMIFSSGDNVVYIIAVHSKMWFFWPLFIFCVILCEHFWFRYSVCFKFFLCLCVIIFMHVSVNIYVGDLVGNSIITKRTHFEVIRRIFWSSITVCWIAARQWVLSSLFDLAVRVSYRGMEKWVFAPRVLVLDRIGRLMDDLQRKQFAVS